MASGEGPSGGSPARFILQPAKLRLGRFVLAKLPPVSFTYAELRAKFVDPARPGGELNLRRLRAGAYIGLLRGASGRAENFFFWNVNRGGDARWLLVSERELPKRLLEVYRVDLADWGGSIEERSLERSV